MEKKDFIFRTTVYDAGNKDGSTKVQLEIGSQKDIQLNEAVGAMIHLVLTQNKKLLDKFYEDHKDLTDEEKENELYSLVAQNLISFQIIMSNVLKEIFGELDPIKLNKAQEDIHKLAMDTKEKSFKNKNLTDE